MTFGFNLPDLEIAESRLGVDVLTVGVVSGVIVARKEMRKETKKSNIFANEGLSVLW